MSKRLLLIAPSYKNEQVMVNINFANFPPLNLGITATLTPDDYDITILDENKQDIGPILEEDFDLVGFTALTNTAPRAYELAAHFKKRGTPTIMGGIHASVLPEEALRYVDAVVRQEIENIWPEVVRDFEAGKLKRLYEGGLVSPERMVSTRRDLFLARYPYNVAPVQTTRGCPYDCEFCTVTVFSGHTYRQRPIEGVIDEIEHLDNKILFLVDDNLIGGSRNQAERAKQLFRGMIDRGIRKEWGAQASVNVVDDKELLGLARESGAISFLLGIESIVPESLKEMKKGVNLQRDYKTVINKLHDHGIGAVGSIMFGNDHDTPDVFDATSQFVLESGIDAVQYCTVTPFPGTRLYERIKNEGRLFRTNYPSDWKFYDGFHPTFYPRKMTLEQLEEGVRRSYRGTNSLTTSLMRMFRTAHMSRFRYTVTWSSFLVNYGEGKLFK